MTRALLWILLSQAVISPLATHAIDISDISGKWRQVGGRCVGGPFEAVIVPEILQISARRVEYLAEVHVQFQACKEVLQSFADEGLKFRPVGNALELSEMTPWISTYCTFNDPANGSEPTVIHHRVSEMERTARRYSLDRVSNTPVLVEEVPDSTCAKSGRFQYLFESVLPTLM